ncbi:hypothetical protein EVAR_85223_1 [Eumeta japonica]|uniref:ATP-dependent DNA helicase n=1 Tax=Eumeta variegata TaxID=151549 RepID=A0A4C1W0N3_EUMVA|nr:hypothetical protein EVAR_85223_1 [Eumeta japonica]
MQENIHDLEENVTSHENEEENYQTPEQMKEDFISNVDHLNTGTPSQPETSVINITKHIAQESPTRKHLQPISPAFASAIIWPSESPIKGNQKRRKKVPLPDAVNSSEWMQYWNEKENIKKEQEEKKALKAANRKMSKKNKKKETGSDEEIPAAPRKMRRLRIDSASDSDDDNVPLIVHKSLEVTAKPKKGDYVIVRYEGAYFPGAVENTDGDLYEISTMTFSTGNTFRWPEQCDKIWYQKDAVEESIAVPTLANSRDSIIEESERYEPITGSLSSDLARQIRQSGSTNPKRQKSSCRSWSRSRSNSRLNASFIPRSGAGIPGYDQKQSLREVCGTLMKAVDDGNGALFFLNAPDGTGKTFLMALISAAIRARSDIAVAVASSSIAATLLKGCRTAHSALKFPLNLQTIKQPTYSTVDCHQAIEKDLQSMKKMIGCNADTLKHTTVEQDAAAKTLDCSILEHVNPATERLV